MLSFFLYYSLIVHSIIIRPDTLFLWCSSWILNNIKKRHYARDFLLQFFINSPLVFFVVQCSMLLRLKLAYNEPHQVAGLSIISIRILSTHRTYFMLRQPFIDAVITKFVATLSNTRSVLKDIKTDRTVKRFYTIIETTLGQMLHSLIRCC